MHHQTKKQNSSLDWKCTITSPSTSSQCAITHASQTTGYSDFIKPDFTTRIYQWKWWVGAIYRSPLRIQGERFFSLDGAIVHRMVQHGQPSNFFVLLRQCFPTQCKSWRKAHEHSLDGSSRAEVLSKTSILLVIPSRQAANVKWDLGFSPKM